jgi:hypothetical protein
VQQHTVRQGADFEYANSSRQGAAMRGTDGHGAPIKNPVTGAEHKAAR